jgi:hypothetical protein
MARSIQVAEETAKRRTPGGKVTLIQGSVWVASKEGIPGLPWHRPAQRKSHSVRGDAARERQQKCFAGATAMQQNQWRGLRRGSPDLLEVKARCLCHSGAHLSRGRLRHTRLVCEGSKTRTVCGESSIARRAIKLGPDRLSQGARGFVTAATTGRSDGKRPKAVHWLIPYPI